MKNLELALQNGAFDAYFLEKLEEMHQENVMQEKLEKGIKIGEEKEKLKMAIKLKNEGVPLEIIAKTSEIPLSKIKKL